MRLFSACFVGWVAASAVAGCSSSSHGSSAEDGGATDGTTSPPEDGGGGDARSDGMAPIDTGALDGPASDADAGAPRETGEASAADGGAEAAAEAGADAGPDAALDAGCGSTPALHADTAGSIFCGYTDAGPLTCTGQECCLGGILGGGLFAQQECTAFGSTCTNGLDDPEAGAPPIPIMCAQISDCAANGVVGAVACCLRGATAPADPAGCTYPKATLGTAVVCEASDSGMAGTAACANGEAQICSSQADCPSGTTCTPGKWKLFQVGFCL